MRHGVREITGSASHRERVYRYRGVPIAVYRAFLAAPSKGRFLAQFIKGFYPYARVA